MKTLIQFADRSFLVDADLAAKVQAAVPADRFVTTTTIDEPPELPHPLLGQRQKPSSTFDRHQQPLTDRQRGLAQRFAAHLAKHKRTS
jgi:hypothetical protein